MMLVQLDDHQWIDADRLVAVFSTTEARESAEAQQVTCIVLETAGAGAYPMRTETPIDEVVDRVRRAL